VSSQGADEMSQKRPNVRGAHGPLALDENKVRWLRVTFEYVDSLLGDIEEVLECSPTRSAFPRSDPDIPAERRPMIKNAIQLIRGRLITIMDDLSISRNRKAIPASRTIRTNLTMIDITLEELKRKEWGGPDSPPQAAEELRILMEGLQEMVAGLERYVDSGDGGRQGG
jgi:hypothetical protein